MPGWHEQTKDLVAAGELVLLGITQEQHAERCQLFAQWKNFDWPILHDPINLLESAAVPIVVAIDETGIVRSTRPNPDWVRTTFVTTNYADQKVDPQTKSEVQSKDTAKQIAALQTDAKLAPNATTLRQLGDALSLWKANKPTLAVDAYRRAVSKDETDPRNHFRLGVALRHRYDSSDRKPFDFRQAVKHWTTALEMNPNQYIWRRRIQQYGPRLIKPYPFYDWVPQAAKEIAARGETPVELRVALSGAEVASPKRTFEIDDSQQESPDPRGRITRDLGEYVHIDAVSVPASVEAGESVRLHLEFELASKQVHWNNESEPLRVWMDTPTGWQIAQSLLLHKPSIDAAESSETRRLEVEVQTPKQTESNRITGYALYYVCDDRTGACLLRRQDFVVNVNVKHNQEANPN